MVRKKQRLGILTDSDFFGAKCLMEACTASISVRALHFCDVMALFAPEFQSLLAGSPNLSLPEAAVGPS